MRDTDQYRTPSWVPMVQFCTIQVYQCTTVSQFPKGALDNNIFTSCGAFHYQNFIVTQMCSRFNLLTSIICKLSSHCPGEQCEGGEGEQQQSYPCQLDPTHPPSGKGVSCVLCDISTISASWKSSMHCQHCQHQ